MFCQFSASMGLCHPLGLQKSTVGASILLSAAGNPPLGRASEVCGTLVPLGTPHPRLHQPLSKVPRGCDSPVLPCQTCEETSGFWSRLEYLGDELTGLVMTKTKAQRGLLEPITHVRKPQCIQAEMGEERAGDVTAACGWPRRGNGMAPDENGLGWRPKTPGGPAPLQKDSDGRGRGASGSRSCGAALSTWPPWLVVIELLEHGWHGLRCAVRTAHWVSKIGTKRYTLLIILILITC